MPSEISGKVLRDNWLRQLATALQLQWGHLITSAVKLGNDGSILALNRIVTGFLIYSPVVLP